MIDAHNHLQDPRFDNIRKQVIEEMKASGITRCVVNGTDPDDWQKVAELAAAHPDFIIPSFGLHPWKKPTANWLEELTSLVTSTPHACIGECGLDRWMKDYDIDLQKEVFLTQLGIAAQRNLPLSIHCLKAWGLLIELLESHPLPERGFLLHSYGGSTELVPKLTELGAYFSFSGYFLHERKAQVLKTFQSIPSDRLLIETDAPDMIPPEAYISHPLPEEINHPANLATITAELSRTVDTSLVLDNFNQFFISQPS